MIDKKVITNNSNQRLLLDNSIIFTLNNKENNFLGFNRLLFTS